MDTESPVPARRLLPVDRMEVAAYRIPTDAPEQDGTLSWDATTIVIVHVHGGKETGVGFTYGPDAIATLISHTLERMVIEGDALSPQRTTAAMIAAIRNAGVPGIGAMAVSAVDVALWDLKAKLLDVPLAGLLGAVRWSVPMYGSGGFTSYDDEQLVEQLGGWADSGVRRVKMKIGRDASADLRRVALARQSIGEHVELFVDANGAYARKQALAQAHAFRQLAGVSWFEEPVSSDDLEGLRLLRDRAPAGIEIAAGEYGYRIDDFRRLVEARAVDVLQADVTRCGGVTGFLAAAALAEAFHVPLSGHCAPALHAHLGCALPVVRHVEYFHDQVRIESMLFDGGPQRVEDRLCVDAERPGLGMEFKAADAEPFRIREFAEVVV